MISDQRLDAAAVRLHRGAEDNHLAFGYAVLAVLLLAEQEERVCITALPGGLPDKEGTVRLARDAAAFGAGAAILTGEVWIAATALSERALRALPDADVPRPGDLPARREAIVTTAYRPANGRITRLATLIERTASGTRLRRASYPGGARDLGAAAFLAALLPHPTTAAGH